MLKRFDNWLGRIIAEQVAKAVSELHVSLVKLHNDTTVSLKVLKGMHVEALRLLTTLEQATPSNVAEKNRLFAQVRSQVTEIANKFEQLHPSYLCKADADTLAADHALKVKR